FIRELNLNGARMLGKERVSLLNTKFKNFIGRDSYGTFSEFYRKVLKTGSKQTCEVRLNLRGESIIYIHLEGIRLESEQGILITAIDLTERKKAEEALKENEARLQDLNATKDKFFSIIAHDLRGPFTTIIGFSGLLMSQVQIKNYEGVEKYATYIQQSSNRAMNLLTNLLEWARLQTGKIKFNPCKIWISEILNEVSELLENTAQQKAITLTMEFSGDTSVFADKEMICSVLRNLISNAIKFTHSGGSVTIIAEQHPDELMMIVSDNGIGITRESLEKLFLIEGNQSKRGTQNEVGTGLGLILCKEFILKHKGNIWVESEPDRGSSFYFTIPKNIELA
ncbi:MAG TPA: ATP-binding protein, partial [Bacteroidales bacterium]|nr:ATP-binding protein [Bacteroidales bacterium]